MEKAILYIEVHHHGDVSQEEAVIYDGIPYYIGRDTKDLKVNYDNISRKHCYFLLRNEKITIVDNDSSNGTHVNGIRIDQTLIQNTDVIQVGNVKMRFNKISILDEPTEATQVAIMAPTDWWGGPKPLTLNSVIETIQGFIKSPFFHFDKLTCHYPWWQIIALFFIGSILYAIASALVIELASPIIISLFFARYIIEFIIFSSIFVMIKRYAPVKGHFAHFASFFAITQFLFLPVWILVAGMPLLELVGFLVFYFWTYIGFNRVFETHWSISLRGYILTFLLGLAFVAPLEGIISKIKKIKDNPQSLEKKSQKEDVLNSIKSSR